MTSGIFRKIQSYDRVDAQGAGEQKTVYVVSPAAAEYIGSIADVRVVAQIGRSASQKYVAHVLFQGGTLTPTPEFLTMLLPHKG